MTTAEKIKKYYEKGIYTDRHLQAFLAKGVITQTEYDLIIGA